MVRDFGHIQIYEGLYHVLRIINAFLAKCSRNLNLLVSSIFFSGINEHKIVHRLKRTAVDTYNEYQDTGL